MAFCNAELSNEDEIKNGLFDEDSLEDVKAFSTSRKQFGLPNPEGLLTNKDGKEIDRRELIQFHDKKWAGTSYNHIYQVIFRVGNTRGCGSGFIEANGYLMTCAHNFCGVSMGSKKIYDKMTSYSRREGESSYAAKFRLDPKTAHVHPNYNNLPDSGFDIALCKIGNSLPSKNWQDIKFLTLSDYWSHFVKNPERLVIGQKIEVNGYPGEKKGFPYTSVGKIKKVLKTKYGGWVLYYDADSTPGVSGAAIQLVVEDKKEEEALKVAQYNYDFPWKITIGVHTGHDEIANLNFGTLITKSIYEWMSDVQLGRLKE